LFGLTRTPKSNTTKATNASTADRRGFVLAIRQVPRASNQMRARAPLISDQMSDSISKIVFTKNIAPTTNPASSNPVPLRPYERL